MIEKNKDLGLLLLRISTGALMLFHGVSKLSHGVEGISNMLSKNGIPGFIAFGVYLGEVIAPILIVLGYRTRTASLLLFLNMLVIVFIAHPQDIFQLTDHGAWKLELAGLYLVSSMALYFMGGGKYALSSSSKWD